MVKVGLDARGALVAFRAVPPQIDESKGPWPDPDWNVLLREAGLDPSRLSPSGSKWLPPALADARAEWDGSFKNQPDVPIHVTAAAHHGRPVYFEVLGPWNRPLRMQEARPAAGLLVRQAAFVFLVLSVLVAALIFARRNLRLGRGDRRGALRVSIFELLLALLAWLVSAHHMTGMAQELDAFSVAGGLALFIGVFVWLTYMALEPYVRRRWPDLLISWTRLLSGGFRDPLVGRDLLIGVLFGGVRAAVLHASNGLAFFLDLPGMTPSPAESSMLASPRLLVASLLTASWVSVIQSLSIMALLILGWVILRKRWLAMAVAGLVMGLLALSGENYAVELPAAFAFAAVSIFVAARFGILALTASTLTAVLLMGTPLTLDFSRWYAGRSFFVILVLAGIAFYGFWTSLGGKSPFGAEALQE